MTLTLQEAWRLSHNGLRLRQWGMILAHAGVAVLAFGITLASTQSVERDVRASPGDSIKVSGYVFTFTGLKLIPGANYKAVAADFKVTRSGQFVAQLTAEKRI